MMRGMPAVMQLTRTSSPCPPRAWSAMLASSRAWYSGISGACCASPERLVWSHCVPTPAGRRHWPDQSGYLVASNAEAAPIVSDSAAASVSAARELRWSIMSSHGENWRDQAGGDRRSEEHTSELQSQSNL